MSQTYILSAQLAAVGFGFVLANCYMIVVGFVKRRRAEQLLYIQAEQFRMFVEKAVADRVAKRHSCYNEGAYATALVEYCAMPFVGVGRAAMYLTLQASMGEMHWLMKESVSEQALETRIAEVLLSARRFQSAFARLYADRGGRTAWQHA